MLHFSATDVNDETDDADTHVLSTLHSGEKVGEEKGNKKGSGNSVVPNT